MNDRLDLPKKGDSIMETFTTAWLNGTCRSCIFWVGKAFDNDRQDEFKIKPWLGECHRRAPERQLERGEFRHERQDRMWPQTHADDGCGEYRYWMTPDLSNEPSIVMDASAPPSEREPS